MCPRLLIVSSTPRPTQNNRTLTSNEADKSCQKPDREEGQVALAYARASHAPSSGVISKTKSFDNQVHGITDRQEAQRPQTIFRVARDCAGQKSDRSDRDD